MNPATLLDKPKAVRAGEELDIDKVDAWLKGQRPELTGTPEVSQYSGGASNWTYCLSYPDIDYILRRAPKGTKAKGAHNMAREFHLQAALAKAYPLVPEMIALCQDSEVLGTDFYVMEKLTGLIPRKDLPRALNLSEAQAAKLCTAMVDALIDLHSVDIKEAKLTELAKGEGYIDRQLNGWSKRYSDARTWNVPSAKGVMRWLQQNKPSKETICLTHNDFRFDNLVLSPEDPSQILSVLDWELATLGDPLMDLGNTLAYWVEADDDFLAQSTRRQPTHLPGMMTRQQVVDYYLEKRGLSGVDFRFYEVFGLFRLAGIAQQIYYRYHHKQTRNPAFKHFWIFVHYLLWRSRKAMKASSARR
ncbi:phosphotransferase family protein [Ferrimonas marina]|uniref:Predicted kinase, aminoglycoside phosphotransferase (APT) family n=1 Tax=Ferrimonas marina TaxID=299255 RepID=A0A1M5RJT2_9GAMM|nr:phosphotransferase family protein [Ferrimonas marina]SHH26379.1 Predicted kinase, aminoglycoside phosphotransferase (APT) family [Ferrimonas marina]